MNHPEVYLLIVEDDPIQQELLLDYLKPYPFIHILDVIKTGDEFIEKATLYSNLSAVLLDVHLGEGKGGLEAYSILQFRGKKVPAILVTGKAIEASYTYDLGIVDIVEKPFTQYRFKQSIKKLCDYLSYQTFVQNGGFYVPVYNDNIEQIAPCDILFIESLNRIIQVHTINRVIETKIPLKAYEKYLQNHHFYLTHRSFLVNLRKVQKIQDNIIYFLNEERTALISEEKVQEIMYYWKNLLKMNSE